MMTLVDIYINQFKYPLKPTNEVPNRLIKVKIKMTASVSEVHV